MWSCVWGICPFWVTYWECPIEETGTTSSDVHTYSEDVRFSKISLFHFGHIQHFSSSITILIAPPSSFFPPSLKLLLLLRKHRLHMHVIHLLLLSKPLPVLLCQVCISGDLWIPQKLSKTSPLVSLFPMECHFI